MLKEKVIRSNYCGYCAVKLEHDRECNINRRDPYMSRNEPLILVDKQTSSKLI